VRFVLNQSQCRNTFKRNLFLPTESRRVCAEDEDGIDEIEFNHKLLKVENHEIRLFTFH